MRYRRPLRPSSTFVESVEEVYQQYTARSLLLAHRAQEPFPVMVYAFLYEDVRDSAYLANIPVASSTRAQIREKRKDISEKTNSW